MDLSPSSGHPGLYSEGERRAFDFLTTELARMNILERPRSSNNTSWNEQNFWNDWKNILGDLGEGLAASLEGEDVVDCRMTTGGVHNNNNADHTIGGNAWKSQDTRQQQLVLGGIGNGSGGHGHGFNGFDNGHGHGGRKSSSSGSGSATSSGGNEQQLNLNFGSGKRYTQQSSSGSKGGHSHGHGGSRQNNNNNHRNNGNGKAIGNGGNGDGKSFRPYQTGKHFDGYQFPLDPRQIQPPSNSNNNECAFCKGNKAAECVYKGHPLRINGKVSCPILRMYRCTLCKLTGDLAHTIKYCPFNTRGFFAPVALENERLMKEIMEESKKEKEHERVSKASSMNGLALEGGSALASLSGSLPREFESFGFGHFNNHNYNNHRTGSVSLSADFELENAHNDAFTAALAAAQNGYIGDHYRRPRPRSSQY